MLIQKWKKWFKLSTRDWRYYRKLIICATSLVLQDNKYGYAAKISQETTKLVKLDDKHSYLVPYERENLPQEYSKSIAKLESVDYMQL